MCVCVCVCVCVGVCVCVCVCKQIHVHYNVSKKEYNRLYTEAKGSMGFIIPEDFMMSEGIINTVDPIG